MRRGAEQKFCPRNQEKRMQNLQIVMMILTACARYKGGIKYKLRNQGREMHTDPSSGTYNVGSDDVSGGEELEMIAFSRTAFRQLS